MRPCSTYLDRLAEEVNDKLQEAGLISIAELCKNYDLPGDFLSEVSRTAAGKNAVLTRTDTVDEGGVCDALCVCVSTSGVVQTAREAHPRRDGRLQQGGHLHAGFRRPAQSQDTRPLQRHHEVSIQVSTSLPVLRVSS